MEKEPDKPGVRFSFSPTMVSPLRSSTSVTLSPPTFLTRKVTGPAGVLGVAGLQPSLVSVTWTVGAWPALPGEDAGAALPQATIDMAEKAAAMVKPRFTSALLRRGRGARSPPERQPHGCSTGCGAATGLRARRVWH